MSKNSSLRQTHRQRSPNGSLVQRAQPHESSRPDTIAFVSPAKFTSQLGVKVGQAQGAGLRATRCARSQRSRPTFSNAISKRPVCHLADGIFGCAQRANPTDDPRTASSAPGPSAHPSAVRSRAPATGMCPHDQTPFDLEEKHSASESPHRRCDLTGRCAPRAKRRGWLPRVTRRWLCPDGKSPSHRDQVLTPKLCAHAANPRASFVLRTESPSVKGQARGA